MDDLILQSDYFFRFKDFNLHHMNLHHAITIILVMASLIAPATAKDPLRVLVAPYIQL